MCIRDSNYTPTRKNVCNTIDTLQNGIP